ncbi:MAG: hypothetical protein RLZZ385_2429 [Pseudomonadota bacterium]
MGIRLLVKDDLSSLLAIYGHLHRADSPLPEIPVAALDFAWDRNCYKVMLMTGQRDEGTFRFYESAGFERNRKEALVAIPDVREQAAAAIVAPGLLP